MWICAEHRFYRFPANSPLTWENGYDMINVLGRNFPSCFFCSGSQTAGQWNDPWLPSGVISVPWVQSLGNLAFCWIDRAFDLGWNPFRKHSCSSASGCDWHLCKTEDFESPAGRCTYHIRYHLFRTIRIPFFKAFCKTGFQTNNFRKNGIKRRNLLFLILKCWLHFPAVIWWLCWGAPDGVSFCCP